MPEESKPRESNLEVILKQVNTLVDLLLRYLLGGGVAVLVFGYLQGQHFDFLRVGQSNEASIYITILLVFTCGISLYVFHRALIYRAVLWLLHWRLIRRLDLDHKPKQLEAILTENRQHRRKETPNEQQYFDTWGAEAHFLYSSAWGSLFAVLFAYGIGVFKPNRSIALMALVLIGILIWAAVVHDLHLMEREIAKAQHPEVKRKPPKPNSK
jgi:sterol desaturase/sphingolipid hydroxylase (fatty acid hydroxylase superfamily)